MTAFAVDARGEGVKAGQVVFADGIEPLGQPLALALGEHGCEGPDVAREGAKLGAVGQDRLEPKLFDLGEGFQATDDHLVTTRGAGGCAVVGRGEVRSFLMRR